MSAKTEIEFCSDKDIYTPFGRIKMSDDAILKDEILKIKNSKIIGPGPVAQSTKQQTTPQNLKIKKDFDKFIAALKELGITE